MSKQYSELSEGQKRIFARMVDEGENTSTDHIDAITSVSTSTSTSGGSTSESKSARLL